MSSLKLLRLGGFLKNIRNLSTTRTLKDVKSSTTPSSTSSGSSQSGNVPNASLMNPTNFEKRLLVFFKRFPSMDEVPKSVSMDVVQKVTSKFRIIMANVMMFFTIVGCYYTITSGKNEAQKQIAAANIEDQGAVFRAAIREEYRKNALAEAAEKKS